MMITTSVIQQQEANYQVDPKMKGERFDDAIFLKTAFGLAQSLWFALDTCRTVHNDHDPKTACTFLSLFFVEWLATRQL